MPLDEVPTSVDDAPNVGDAAPAQPAMSMASVRQKFPAYQDMSDDALARGLHKRYYADMPFDAFAGKIGYQSDQSFTATSDIPIQPGTAPAGTGGLGRTALAIGQGLREGFGDRPLGIGPESESFMRRAGVFPPTSSAADALSNPLRAANEAVVRPLLAIPDAVLRAGAAAVRAYQRGVSQGGEEVGAPGFGRDLAALPEAFPQELMGLPGGLRTPRGPVAEPPARAPSYTAPAPHTPAPETPPSGIPIPPGLFDAPPGSPPPGPPGSPAVRPPVRTVPPTAEQPVPGPPAGGAVPPEAPPAGPRSAAEIQRTEGVGFNEATRRAQAERDAYQQQTGPIAPEQATPHYVPVRQLDGRVTLEQVLTQTETKPAPQRTPGGGQEPPPPPEATTIEAPAPNTHPNGVIPTGSGVRFPDFTQVTGVNAGNVIAIAGNSLVVQTPDGNHHDIPKTAAQVETLAPLPPPPRSATEIQRAEGIGAVEAIRRAKAERDAYQQQTGVVSPDNPVDDHEAMANDPRSPMEIQQELDGIVPPPAPVDPNALPPRPLTAIEQAAGNVAAPTPAQADAGNYRMGHIRVGGLAATIETPLGSERTGVSADGTPWSSTMGADYGYIRGTKGADGDHVDAYFGPEAARANPPPVWMLDQIEPASGLFDEHKAMIGFPDRNAALTAYHASFSDGSAASRIGAITAMPWQQFRAWVASGNTKQPVAYVPPPSVDQQAAAQGAADTERHKQALTAIAGVLATQNQLDLTRAQINEAAVEHLAGLTPAEAILKVAHRHMIKAIVNAGATPHVEQPRTESTADQTGARSGGQPGRPAGGPGAGIAPSGQQPAGSGGHLPTGGSGPATTVGQPGAEAGAEGSPSGIAETGRGGAGSPENRPGSGNAETTASTVADAENAAGGGGDLSFGTLEAPNVEAIARGFAAAFAAGTRFLTITEARKFVATHMGVPQIPTGAQITKVIDEAIELGVVLRARQIVEQGRAAGEDAGQIYDALVDLYGMQPKLSVRTGESIANQAYSTPMPLAWAASVLANIIPGEWVYEPTAGNGALLIGATQQTTIANEIDPLRLAALRAQGFQPTAIDASGLNPVAPPMSVGSVIANPPFGPVRGADGKSVRFDLADVQRGYETNEIDHAIALRSLTSMTEDGSAVLILGGISKQVTDAKSRAAAYNGKSKREFYFTLYNQYNIVDHFTVPGELYAKQGAGWPVDVIVIRGRGKSALPLPFTIAPRVVPSWGDIREIVSAAPPAIDGRAERLADYGSADPAGMGAGGHPGRDGNPADQGVAGGGAATGSVLRGPGVAGGVDAGDLGEPGARDSDAGVGSPGARPVDRPVGVHEGVAGGDDDDQGQPGVPQLPGTDVSTAGMGNAAAPNANGGPNDQGNDVPGVARPGHPNAPVGLKGPRVPSPAPSEVDRDEIDTDVRQAEYHPSSNAVPVGTLVPTNLASATANALDGLTARIAAAGKGASVDEFVAGKLKYQPSELADYFSAEQVDAIALGIDQVDNGQAAIVGDQTGIGKGRVIAGIIRYAEIKGVVPIFITQDPSLYVDMVRDLTAIGMADMASKILATNNSLKLNLTEEPGGPALRTSGKKGMHDIHLREVASHVQRTGKLPPQYRVLMTTYAQMQTVKGQRTTRQLLLTGLAPNAFVIMDESHNAGGVSGAEEKVLKNGKLILPRSVFFRQIISAAHSAFFSSATWAKRPDVLDLYGIKTSMRFAVPDLGKLADAISAGGIPMQQIATAALATAGQYIRRERSFEGVAYDMSVVPVDQAAYGKISEALKAIYDVSAQSGGVVAEISETIKGEAEAASSNKSVGKAGADSTSFGAVMHNLIGQMLLAMKAPGAADLAIKAIKDGKKPVIALANTMGSFIEEFAKENGLNNGAPIALTFNQLLLRYLKKTLVYTEHKPYQQGSIKHELKPEDLPDGGALYRATAALIKGIDLTALPVSPIDYIRRRLEAAGYSAGEITGRTNTIAYDAQGKSTYHIRQASEMTKNAKNVTISAFNGGSLDAVIINQSGATGISLHANRTFKDKRQRVMLIAQAENNIDTFMQMLGRIHRTGQVVLPAYLQLVADIPAERRPAAVLAAKMASLNASTTGARKSAMGDDKAPDFMNEYGDEVVGDMLRDDARLNEMLMKPLGGEDDDGIARKVTGRLPLLPPDMQQKVIDDIERLYEEFLAEKDAAGENALEAKTLALDATLISREIVVDGNPAGVGPFAEPAYLGRYDVKRTTKPPSIHSITTDFARINERSDLVPGPDEGPEAMAEVFKRVAADDPNGATIANVQSTYKTEQNRSFKTAEAKDRHLERVRAATRAILDILKIAKPGAVFDIVTKNGDKEDVQPGLLQSIHINEDLGDLAPSKYTFVFIGPEGERRPIRGTQLIAPKGEGAEAQIEATRTLRPWSGTTAEYLTNLEALSKLRREERWILSGNILAAYSLGFGGQITNYTDDKGRIQQGIILRRTFDAADALRNTAQPLRGDLALRFLTSNQGDMSPYIDGSDGALHVARDSNGDYVVSVPLSKEKGGAYYLNPTLRQMPRNGFVSKGDRMIGTVNQHQGSALMLLLERIMGQQKGVPYFVSTHPAAKAFAASQRAGSAGAGAQGNGQRRVTGLPADAAAPAAPRSPPIKRAALQVLAGTIHEMTGNRVEVDVFEKPAMGTVLGYTVGGSLIVVALQDQAKTAWTLHHETIHSLHTFGLIKPQEWTVLHRTARVQNWETKFGIAESYSASPPEVRAEEAIAEGFAEFMQNRGDAPKGGVLPAAIQRSKIFFARLRNALAGAGFQTAQDVYERVASGEAGKREAEPNRPVLTPEQGRREAVDALGLARIAGEYGDVFRTLDAQELIDQDVREAVAKVLSVGPGNIQFALGPQANQQAQAGTTTTTAPAPRGSPRPLQVISNAFSVVSSYASDFAAAAQMAIAPMSVKADDEARKYAKDFICLKRATRHTTNFDIEEAGRLFTRDQLKKMFEAADADSIAAQRGLTNPATFGLASLTPAERTYVQRWLAFSEVTFRRAKRLNMVKADELPFYVPHEMVNVGSRVTRPDEPPHVVQDFRTLILVVGRLNEAIAGKILIDNIREFGKRIGQQLVATGEIPSNHSVDLKPITGITTSTSNLRHRAFETIEEAEDAASHIPPRNGKPWFTIKANPAFYEWQWRTSPADPKQGQPVRQPIYIHPSFEAPLRAVLHEPHGVIYKGYRELKSKLLSTILYGVMHLGVVGFRAVSVRPNLWSAVREGKAVQRDRNEMRRLIMAGLVPMGKRGLIQDAEGIESELLDKAGNSWTSQILGFVPDLFSEKAGHATKKTIDRLGTFVHGYLMWDVIASMQVGVAKGLERQFIAKGVSQEVATKVAVRFANTAAGAISQETMGQMARAVLNVLLFSVSYRTTSFTPIKDAIFGIPRDLESQLRISGGQPAVDLARSIARRLALKTILIDAALLVGLTSVAQNAFNISMAKNPWSMEALKIEGEGYVRRVMAAGDKIAKGEAINPFDIVASMLKVVGSLTPMADHEDGKKWHLKVGIEPNGTAVYVRPALGKFAQDMFEYATESPIAVLGRIESPFARIGTGIMTGKDSLGRDIAQAKPQTTAEERQKILDYVTWGLRQLTPDTAIQAGRKLASGEGGKFEVAQILGGGLGFSFSHGYPGGKEKAIMHDIRQQHEFDVQRGMTQVTQLVKAGKPAEAFKILTTDMHMQPREAIIVMNHSLNPSVITGGMLIRSLRNAHPELAQKLTDELRLRAGGSQ